MKDKRTAALLALFLGWGGVHKFYLNDTGSGIFYIMLTMFGSSLGVPIGGILGVIDAFALFTMSEERFDKKYNSNRRVRRTNTRTERRSNRRNPYQESEQRNRYDKRGRPVKNSDRRERGERRSSSNETSRSRKRKVIKDNPFKNSGIKRLKDFELDLAEADLIRAIELSPDDMDIHFAMGQLYSLNEDKKKSFYHLSKAISLGFSDMQRIRTTDELAYLRVQPEFEEFEQSGFKYEPTGRKAEQQKPKEQETPASKTEAPKDDLLQDDLLLAQLNKLAELRNKGLLSEREFEQEKIKLTRR